jgi:hypothetical protein
MKPGNNYTIEGDTIIPKPDFNGTFYIETYVKDPEGGKSATFNLLVVVDPVNDVPRFITEPEDTAIVNETYIYPFIVEDPDDVNVQITVVEKPGWMTFYPSSNLLAGVPTTSDIGYTRIRIRAYDGKSVAEQRYYMNVLLGTSSTDPQLSGNQVTIYPNPAAGKLFVLYKNQKEAGIFSLYDQLGRIITENNLYPGQDAAFSVTGLNLKPGIYLYIIQYGAETTTGKLIVQPY